MYKLTEEEKKDIDSWYNGIGKDVSKIYDGDKLIDCFKVCNERGYFIQSVETRKVLCEKEIYYNYSDKEVSRILNMELSKVPNSYFQTHTEDQITEDLLYYINNYQTYIGDSVYNSGFVINEDGVIYYSWDGSDKDECPLAIDTRNKLAIFQFSGESIKYTEPDKLHEAINKIREELFIC